MIVFPNAKINLGLKIIEKREDGFHSIKSILYPIPLHDILEINKGKETVYSYSGIPIEGDSLLKKAVELLREDFDFGGLNIHLHKQIPIGSGLGGGSSDAVFILRAINDLFEMNLSNLALRNYALKLGSDCPFFIDNIPALVSGRGEILAPSPISLKNKFVKVVFPDERISTAHAFSSASKRNSVFNPAKMDLTNDFEEWAISAHPALKELQKHLRAEGANFVSMSGTGSSFYGIYNERPNKSTQYPSEWIMKLEQPQQIAKSQVFFP
jgi:4-diphosphocytidyl-2-C-methyl-D-erythritol kinase